MICDAALELHALPIPAPLDAAVAAGVIHQNPAHRLRCQSVEVRAILPIHAPAAGQFQKNFVHQRGGLQGVAGALIAELGHGHPVQFVEDKRPQLGLRVVIARPDTFQDCREVGRLRIPFHAVNLSNYIKRCDCTERSTR